MRIFIKDKLIALFGTVYCTLLTVFLIMSIPVYIFRILVIWLAKIFRPDLGEILSGQSGIFVADYMAESTPRSNLVFTLIFQGHLPLELLRSRIMKNWILSSEKLNLKNFQRYPHQWLGFTFWKDASKTFSLEKHLYRYSGKDTQVTDQQLTEIIEQLGNKRSPRFQSPWELALIENYKNPHAGKETQQNEPAHSVLIIKWHHCLVDGVGMMTAVMHGLFELPWKQTAASHMPKKSFWQRSLYLVAFPFNAFCELSNFLSHTFRSDPFKLPSGKKDWYQVYAKSGPIQIQKIKDIKNALGVNYTSVILSAMSSAIYKTLEDFPHQKKNKSMLCLSVLPARGISKRKILSNHMSAAIIDLPISGINNIERLKMVDRMLEETRNSVVPVLSQRFSALVGDHTYLVTSFLAKNRMVPIGLTNFVSAPANVELNAEIKWIHSALFAEGHGAGVCIASISHGENMEIHVCAERTVMSREQATEFLYYIKQEIQNLHNLIPKITYYK